MRVGGLNLNIMDFLMDNDNSGDENCFHFYVCEDPPSVRYLDEIVHKRDFTEDISDILDTSSKRSKVKNKTSHAIAHHHEKWGSGAVGQGSKGESGSDLSEVDESVSEDSDDNREEPIKEKRIKKQKDKKVKKVKISKSQTQPKKRHIKDIL